MSVTPAGREEGEIQAILLDSGLEDDADLRRSLQELRGLAQDPAPQPRADLAALLADGASASGVPAQGETPQSASMRRASNVASLELHRRNRQRRMGIVVGAAVVGAMGLGAGAVAASSEDFRNSVSHTVVRIFQPTSQTTAPMPVPTSPAGIPAAPAPTVAAPKPSVTGTAASSAPATPAQTDPASSNGSSNSSAANGSSGSRGATKSQTPAPARPSQLPTVPGTGVAPKLPAKPLPAVPTVPGGMPTVPAKPVPGTP
ncbi:hypothetical protein QFZ23_000821 [Arthrobacter globiformis]|uniref:hypothetical protein n=1 Tax=Arthrobacter globiformis TaxID=1665 RepID=UPI0027875890|nr:hypothetical protein [Arthrobacter globiformis]MDQ1056920.1 hypothetical protein [Arthrobacter globiformis]